MSWLAEVPAWVAAIAVALWIFGTVTASSMWAAARAERVAANAVPLHDRAVQLAALAASLAVVDDRHEVRKALLRAATAIEDAIDAGRGWISFDRIIATQLSTAINGPSWAHEMHRTWPRPDRFITTSEYTQLYGRYAVEILRATAEAY